MRGQKRLVLEFRAVSLNKKVRKEPRTYGYSIRRHRGFIYVEDLGGKSVGDEGAQDDGVRIVHGERVMSQEFDSRCSADSHLGC